jgi:hypothetical protein
MVLRYSYRGLAYLALKRLLKGVTHHQCYTMLWRKCQYGSYEHEYAEENRSFRKDITTEAAIAKLMYLGRGRIKCF